MIIAVVNNLKHRLRLVWVALAAGWLVTSATAQEIHFAAQPGPYYVGEPVVVQVIVTSLKPGAALSCRLKGTAPDGLSIDGPRVSQSARRMSVIIINGKRTASESMDFRFNFIVTASREGEFIVGPFLLEYGGTSQEIDGKKFRFEKLTSDPDMLVECTIPQSSVYVGQQVPLTIQWAFAGSLEAAQYAFSHLQIRSPLFDQFQFTQPARRAQNTLLIATAKGPMRVGAEVTRQQRDGREYIVVTGQLTFVPDTPGKFESIPITCRTKKATQWRRDIFGKPTAARPIPAISAGQPISFEVKPIPLAGRPASYRGAVGSGFSIETAANRSVVRVGDPISLSVSIRGDGNLGSVSLPDLSGNPGLSDDLFHLPSSQVAGTFDGTTRQFKINISVKNQAVKQIPAIAFSWFDPALGQYRTTSSKPIALQVRETHVVSAADVISSAKRGSNQAAEGQGAGNGSSADDGAQRATGLSFVGANLAIERDLARLAVNATSLSLFRQIAIGLYGLAAAAIAGGIVLRRRAQMDTDASKKQKKLKTLRRQISDAQRRPPREAATLVAKVLRALLADFDTTDRRDIESIIAECENRIYALDDQDDSGLAAVFERAMDHVDNAAGA